MQNLVIIPTYDRPEMLWLCLEHLAECPHQESIQIRVVVDAHIGQPPTPTADIQAVLEKFPQLSLQVGYRTPHQFPGNSFNVLMAYRDAYHQAESEYVYLVEDDVMVHPLFFAWHQMQHETYPDLGCSIAVMKEPQHGHYASLGVCFRREMLKLILPHCRVAYFQNVRAYCRARFPPSKSDCEQDGLFCRLLIGHRIIWATSTLAQHVGWYGYHRRRSVRPIGTLEDRYIQVKHALANSEILQGHVKDFWDIKPLQLTAPSGTVVAQPSRLPRS